MAGVHKKKLQARITILPLITLFAETTNRLTYLEAVKKYSETELVLLLKQRDQSAFSYLYDNYSGALLSVINNIVSEIELSNDVLQEVFIKIWRQIESYDDSKGRLFTWMLNISRNASIDTVRSKGFQNNRQNDELTDRKQEAAGSTVMAIDQIGLRKVVHQMKDEYRTLIELAYFQGYTQEEIAKIEGIPIGTVKTRIRNALIQLRTVIKE